MCGSEDCFNEEVLFYRPPLDVFRRALTHTQSPINSPSYKNRIETAIEHPLPCTRKIRHKPIPCEAYMLNVKSCNDITHWKLCPGYYSVVILVSYCRRNVRFSDLSFDDYHSQDLDSMSVIDVLPRGTSYSTYITTTGETDGPCQILHMDWKNKMDEISEMLFNINYCYCKVDYFYYVTDLGDKTAADLTGRIMAKQVPLFKEAKHSVLYNREAGVLMSCSTHKEGLPSVSPHGRQRLLIPVKNILTLLISEKRKKKTRKLRMYFNSIHRCRGQFGVDNWHIVLALTCKGQKAAQQLCVDGMIEMDTRYNELLQIDVTRGIVKCVESMNPGIRIWIDVLLFGDISLDAINTVWDEVEQDV